MPAPHDSPTATRPATVTWGIVGSLHRIEPLTVLPGQSGVVRFVSNAVKYTRPPIEMAWSEVKAEPGRYEMIWPGDLAAARSLDRIGEELRKRRVVEKSLPPDHPLCRELDETVSALLLAADKLERAGWGVGLLTPAGVIVDRTSEGSTVALVDLGFTWTGEFGEPPWEHSPGRPPWLVADPAENPASLAWDRPPVEQQFAAPGGSPFPPAAPGSNARVLAHVIAWTLTGQPTREIAESPTWSVMSILKGANEGTISTPGALFAELQATPPSMYFTGSIPVVHKAAATRKRKHGAALLLIPILFLLVVLTGLLTRPRDDQEKPGQPPQIANADAQQALKDYNETPAADLPGRLEKFHNLANTAKDSNNPDLSKLLGEARVKLFADWISTCETELAAGADAAKRGETGYRLRKLTDGYARIHKDHPPADSAHRDKEQQWLDQYDRLADSLGWPR